MRSRSPQEDNAGKPVPSAEKATKAPVFVEPGSEGDVAGVLPNSQRVFEYLAHLEQVVNDHAELLNASDAAGDSLRRKVEQQSLETAHVKEVVTRADGVTKQAIEEHDHRLRQDTAKEIHGVWEFLTNNNAGIRQLFNEADNAVAKLVQNVDEMKGRVDNLENKPSTVAAGPKGLAFVGSELTSRSSKRRWRPEQQSSTRKPTRRMQLSTLPSRQLARWRQARQRVRP